MSLYYEKMLKLKLPANLRKASLNAEFTGLYEKKCSSQTAGTNLRKTSRTLNGLICHSILYSKSVILEIVRPAELQYLHEYSPANSCFVDCMNIVQPIIHLNCCHQEYKLNQVY